MARANLLNYMGDVILVMTDTRGKEVHLRGPIDCPLTESLYARPNEPYICKSSTWTKVRASLLSTTNH